MKKKARRNGPLLSLLKDARDVLGGAPHLAHSADGKDAEGCHVDPESGDAVCFCIRGALYRASADFNRGARSFTRRPVTRALQEIARTIKRRPLTRNERELENAEGIVFNFNDGSASDPPATKESAVALFDRVIRRVARAT